MLVPILRFGYSAMLYVDEWDIFDGDWVLELKAFEKYFWDYIYCVFLNVNLFSGGGEFSGM